MGFPKKIMFRLADLRCAAPVSIVALAHAAAYRTAVKTSACWRAEKDRLDVVRAVDPLLISLVSESGGLSKPW